MHSGVRGIQRGIMQDAEWSEYRMNASAAAVCALLAVLWVADGCAMKNLIAEVVRTMVRVRTGGLILKNVSWFIGEGV